MHGHHVEALLRAGRALVVTCERRRDQRKDQGRDPKNFLHLDSSLIRNVEHENLLGNAIKLRERPVNVLKAL